VRLSRSSRGTPFIVASQALKFGSFAKLFRSTVEPDLVTSILAVVAKHTASGDGDEAAGAGMHKLIVALTNTPSFDMTVMMFTTADKAGVYH
jgi:hypothetical protein